MSKIQKFPDIGGSSIHQVVIARHFAHKFKSLSTNLVLQRKRNADKGDFQVTHVDEPTPQADTIRRPPPIELLTPRSTRKSTVSGNYTPFSYALKEQANQITYQLEPATKLQADTIRGVIQQVLESELQGKEYSPELCSNMTKSLCDMIKERVKCLQFSRYKYIVVVVIGQKSGQSVRVTSRCVWDTRFDNHAQYVFEGSGDVFAVGTVYGVYHE